LLFLRGGGVFENKINGRLLKITVGSVVIVSVLLAFINFTIGVIGFRYTCDIRPALALLSGLIMLFCWQNVSGDSNSCGILYSIFISACVITIILGSLMIFSGEMIWIYKLAPQIYAKWFNLFLF
jgi:hypothetical protein